MALVRGCGERASVEGPCAVGVDAFGEMLFARKKVFKVWS